MREYPKNIAHERTHSHNKEPKLQQRQQMHTDRADMREEAAFAISKEPATKPSSNHNNLCLSVQLLFPRPQDARVSFLFWFAQPFPVACRALPFWDSAGAQVALVC